CSAVSMANPLMRQDRQPDQMDVVCKITPTTQGAAEALQSPALALELSCCLQDRTAAACGPAVSAAGGCAPQPRGASRAIVSSNRDWRRAIYADCRGTPRGIPDQSRSSLCGSRCAAFV